VAKKKTKKVKKPDRPKRAVNLSTEQGHKRYVDSYDKHVVNQGFQGIDPYDAHSRFEDFLKTLDQPLIRFDKWNVFPTDKDGTILVLDRVVHLNTGRPEDLGSRDFRVANDEPEGILVTSCQQRTKANKGFRAIVLCNGDEDVVEDEFVNYVLPLQFPTISFECLARFYYQNTARGSTHQAQRRVYEEMVRRLAKGEIELVDFTPDEGRDLRPNDKKELAKIRRDASKLEGTSICHYDYIRNQSFRIKAPALGFNLLNINEPRKTRWHRTGTVVLRDGDMHILMGRDEDTYFGCELPEACSSVAEAIKCLTPVAARQSSYSRQGEWFMVPVNKDDVPQLMDRVLTFYHECVLPLDHHDSNEHSICTQEEGCVGNDGTVYVLNGTLKHEEHSDLETKGWYSLHRNTAVRSFSQEGVD
jgi:hypothetical protein